MLQATTTGTFQVNPPLPVREAAVRSRAPFWNSALLPALATVLLPLIGFYLLVQYWDTVVAWGSWGYLGVFLAELANSAVILVPTPGPAYAFAMGVTLDPLSLGLIGGVAAPLGELTGYMLGARGRHVVEGGRRYERFKALTMRWTGGALFTFALMPIPFDVAGVWAGAMRYPLWRFLVFVTPGKVLKVTSMALAGSYSVDWLLGPLG